MKATKYTLCSDAFLPVNVYQNDCNYIVHYCGKQTYLRFSFFFVRVCVCAFVVAGVSVGGINVVAYSVVVVVLFIVLMLHLSL